MSDLRAHGKRGPQARAARNDRALLRAAKEVLARDGAHASVAAIAERAGVGIGSLYRRYRTKTELFQRLCVISLEEHLQAAEEGLKREDPWEGLEYYLTSAITMGTGSLAPIAGTVEVTEAMVETNARSDRAVEALVQRARAAGMLRSDVTQVDIALLIEQLGKSPLLEQLAMQGRSDLTEAAERARARIIRIALDGLRAGAPEPLPGDPPGYELFSERWQLPDG
ncbi:TetR/AcrR family transcriptional regulator [Phytoactinopolyspora halotolerans]|uniref:TetR/AcrR family transcriptional regulator n=1 Tax=Phytoactinopolyspora halotolerans TaxID=1981512 RepID=UPI001C20B7F7|nr:TetR/AcrR family transcriptional regulator [Phytoactinopolyspora halotolerans]